MIGLSFPTSIGLGAAAPSTFAPKWLRATFLLLVDCGFSLGFVVAGSGWRSLIVQGAVAPLVLVLAPASHVGFRSR